MTLHRPANVDDPAVLGALPPALAEIAARCARWCCPRIRGRLARCASPGRRRVRIIPPAGYLDFIALEAAARLVLTDSGGVQEETTVLGVPCLTLRDNTERPITITEGPTGWSAGTRTGSSGRRARCWPRRRPCRGPGPVGRPGRRADRRYSGRGVRQGGLTQVEVRRGESAGATRSDHGNNRARRPLPGSSSPRKGMRSSGWSGAVQPEIPVVEDVIPSIQLLEGICAICPA